MRVRIFITLFSIFTSTALAAPPVTTEWTAPFGTRVIEKPDGGKETVTLFLMRSGFFLAPTVPDLEAKLKELLSESPGVREVDVAESMMLEGTRSVYVWLVIGGRNLNVEMVRNGWFAGGTQVGGAEWTLLVPQGDDDSFVQQLRDAEQEAREHRRGIWAQEDGTNEANKRVEATPVTSAERRDAQSQTYARRGAPHA